MTHCACSRSAAVCRIRDDFLTPRIRDLYMIHRLCDTHELILLETRSLAGVCQ